MAIVNVEVSTQFDKLSNEVRSQMGKAAWALAKRGAEDAKRRVAPGVGPGPHPHPGRVDTGNLMRSIQGRALATGAVFTAAWGTDVEYGIYLEFGTVKMPPYPWLVPSYEAMKPEALEGYEDAVKTAIKTVCPPAGVGYKHKQY